FLDGIEAYAYFPLAVARNVQARDADLQVEVLPQAGSIDRAGGLAFGLKNSGNYFAFRVNALEDNAVLFEFVDNRRLERAKTELPVAAGRWTRLEVQVRGNRIVCLVDGRPVLEYDAAKQVGGYVGLWTRADSVTQFRDLVMTTGGISRQLILPADVAQDPSRRIASKPSKGPGWTPLSSRPGPPCGRGSAPWPCTTP
ncbi:MAG: hypothetical protein Q8O35_04935, partial [Humidesulfovibrio sp.]|nr:hypothetical protein [Humidesulfovibrio sp.]